MNLTSTRSRGHLIALVSLGVLVACGASLLSQAGDDQGGGPGTDPPGKARGKAPDFVPPPPPPPPDYDFGAGSDPIKWRKRKQVNNTTILDKLNCDTGNSSVGKIPTQFTDHIDTFGACPKDGCPAEGCSEAVKTACEKYHDADDDWVNKDWNLIEYAVMIIDGNSFQIGRTGSSGNYQLEWKKGKAPMRKVNMQVPPKDLCGDLDLLLVRFQGQDVLRYVHKVGIWKPISTASQD